MKLAAIVTFAILSLLGGIAAARACIRPAPQEK